MFPHRGEPHKLLISRLEEYPVNKTRGELAIWIWLLFQTVWINNVFFLLFFLFFIFFLLILPFLNFSSSFFFHSSSSFFFQFSFSPSSFYPLFSPLFLLLLSLLLLSHFLKECVGSCFHLPADESSCHPRQFLGHEAMLQRIDRIQSLLRGC